MHGVEVMCGGVEGWVRWERGEGEGGWERDEGLGGGNCGLGWGKEGEDGERKRVGTSGLVGLSDGFDVAARRRSRVVGAMRTEISGQ